MRKLGVFIFSLGLLCSNYEAHCGGGMSKIAKAAVVGVATGGVGFALGAPAAAAAMAGATAAAGAAAGTSTRAGVQINGNGDVQGVRVTVQDGHGRNLADVTAGPNTGPAPAGFRSTPVSRPPLFGDEVADWKERQIVREGITTRSERLSYARMLQSTNNAVRFHGFDTNEVKRSILQKGTQTLYRYQYNYTDFLLSGNGSDKGYSFKTGYKMPENRTFFDNLKTDAERIASQSFIFEKTGLTWSFNLEFINGKEYHRAHCEGLRDILVPVGKRYIIWSMDRKLNPNSSFVSEMSKYMQQRPNALKTEDRPKRAVSPEPVDTAYRKVCKVKDAVVNDCVNKVVNSIPSTVKEGCKVCFQYLKKADDVSFNVVSTVVDVTLGNVVRGLDWLDKSAEMSGAGVRRYLRDGLGIDQATAQNIGDGLEVGMKMLISIVPAKTMNLASNASKRLVKLSPAGGPSNGFKFKFYDENVIYKEIKPTKGKAKGGSTYKENKVLSAPAMQRHHIFPQKYRPFFEKIGINIDNHCIDLSQRTHLSAVHGSGNSSQMPGRWNQKWADFIKSNPNASSEDVFKFAGKMLDEFGLNNCKIVNYK